MVSNGFLCSIAAAGAENGYPEAYLALSIVLVYHISFRLICKTKGVGLSEIDVASSRMEQGPETIGEERAV
jgi:amino acid permease